MEAEKIVSIIDSIGQSVITEAEIKTSDFRIVIRKGISQKLQVPELPVQMLKAQDQANRDKEAAARQADDPSLRLVKSPVVGTFLLSSKPDAPLFVEKGDKVKKGAILCIVEAMGIANEINAEFDCEVADILTQNGGMAEYGQVLLKIRVM